MTTTDPIEDQELDDEQVSDPGHLDASGQGAQSVEQAASAPSDPEAGDGPGNGESPDSEPDTFPRDYVEQLRQENGHYRQRAQRADQLGERLHTALVAATGRLADPTDLPFDEAHLDDQDALTTAVDELLTRKPHLAARRPRGDVGQGAGDSGTVDLAGLLRARAG